MSGRASPIRALVSAMRRVVRSTGFDVIRVRKDPLFALSEDYDDPLIETIRAVTPFTMTSPQRIAALCEATRYVVRAHIPGAIVECGVWRGGSMMAVARTLLEAREATRQLFLYDTFSGMPMPGDRDVTQSGDAASALMQRQRRDDPTSIWCHASLQAVMDAVFSVGYPRDKIRFIEGRVEETIPATVPERIALLRLDTDWYESTRHELAHLFPRVAKGGVLIVDDYGHWQGARQAVDEYIAGSGAKLLLNRIDYSGRIAVKVE